MANECKHSHAIVCICNFGYTSLIFSQFVGKISSYEGFEKIQHIACQKDRENQNVVMASYGEDLFIAFEGTRTNVVNDILSKCEFRR